MRLRPGFRPETSLGELTAHPRPTSWIWWKRKGEGEWKELGMERERKGKQEKREREKKGMGMELRGDWRGEWGRGLEGLEVERE